MLEDASLGGLAPQKRQAVSSPQASEFDSTNAAYVPASES